MTRITQFRDRAVELEEDIKYLEDQAKLKEELLSNAFDRLDKLEAFIIDTRGELPGPQELKPKIIQAISDILPDIKAYADSIRRGTGTAANYEYQFRHAEHRAKLTKTNLIAAKKLMAGMIVTVASIADRTANSVNPEDIHQLRGELDKLTADHLIIEHVAVDSFLDGVMPPLDLMEGTGKANPDKPIRQGRDRRNERIAGIDLEGQPETDHRRPGGTYAKSGAFWIIGPYPKDHKAPGDV